MFHSLTVEWDVDGGSNADVPGTYGAVLLELVLWPHWDNTSAGDTAGGRFGRGHWGPTKPAILDVFGGYGTRFRQDKAGFLTTCGSVNVPTTKSVTMDGLEAGAVKCTRRDLSRWCAVKRGVYAQKGGHRTAAKHFPGGPR